MDAFALGLDDLACGTAAARFGELLCVPRATAGVAYVDATAVSHHFARPAHPDFGPPSAVTYSDPGPGGVACRRGGDPPAKRVRVSPLEAAFATAGGLSVESFSSSLADGSLSTALGANPAACSPSRTHSPPTVHGAYAPFAPPTARAAAAAKREPVAPATPAAAAAAADCARRTQHRATIKSHTRKCREKVNEKFDRLLEALPVPPPGVEVKHKAQVLEYAIRVFRALIARRAALRVGISLSSPHAVARWACAEVAARAAADGAGIAPLVEAFARLYAAKNAWQYAEVWGSPSHRAANIVLVGGDAGEKIAAFARAKVPAGGMVKRAFASHQAEWLPEVCADNVAFARATAAEQCGLRVALAVPVVTCDGACVAVLLLAHMEARAYSTVEVAEVTDFARVVGDAYAQHVAEGNGGGSGASQNIGATPATAGPTVKQEAVESKAAPGEHDGFDIDAAFAFAGPSGHHDAGMQGPALAEFFPSGLGDLRLLHGTELAGMYM